MTSPGRIGELLVRDGIVTADDVREALAVARAQRLRLVSALVTLGRLGADDAARALARHHGVPAALPRHLEARDLALAGLVPGGLARELGVVPIAVQRHGDALVVCARDPSPQVAARLQAVTGRAIVLAVAPVLLLAPVIAETYADGDGVPEEYDVDVDDSGPVVAADDFDPLSSGVLQLVDLDDHGVAKDPMPSYSTGPFVAAGAEPGTSATPSTGVRRISSPLAAVTAPPPAAPARALALDPALVAIAAAASGDDVVDAVAAYLRHRFRCGAVFVVRDGLALGQAGFGSDAADDAIAAMTVPLAQPSVLQIAHDRAATYVGAPVTGSVVQDRLSRLFGAIPDEVVVVPVVVNARVVNLLYGHAPRLFAATEAAAELATLADAAAQALLRIILEAREART